MDRTPRLAHNLDSKTTITSTINQQSRTYSSLCNSSSDSPFRLLPSSITTPPSHFGRIKNPFESSLNDRLHLATFSPSVFSKSTVVPPPPAEDNKFKWAIEEISTLQPADIDENSVHLQESPSRDSFLEKTAQANIERYFSKKHIVPSPLDMSIKCKPLLVDCSQQAASLKKLTFKEGRHASAQTILSLPFDLPEHVEEALRPYFTFRADQQQQHHYDPSSADCDVAIRNKYNSSLMQGLFDFNEEDEEQPSPALTSPAPSCNLSPIDLSPAIPLTHERRHDDNDGSSPQGDQLLSDCELSPIQSFVQCSSGSRVIAMSQRFSRFSSNLVTHYPDDDEPMCVDMSIPRVPDGFDDLSSPNHHGSFDNTTTLSPLCEQHSLSTSSINWDIEYKQVQILSPNSNRNQQEMDVSSSISHTPKSRIFLSQRKKLSESFLYEESDESDEKNDDDSKKVEIDNNKENKRYVHGLNNLCDYEAGAMTRLCRGISSSSSNSNNSSSNIKFNDITDAGYHTGGNTMSEEWNSSYLFGSTPTKSGYRC